MLQRKEWLNLNGLWFYAIRPRTEARPVEYDGQILVPFCVESTLSGVGRPVDENQQVWYQQVFKIPRSWRNQRVLLHFEAVDWRAQVWVNDQLVGRHEGGYDPFEFDITPYLKKQDNQELIVAVWDPTDKGTQPRGKQVQKPGGIFYTSTTGIWGTVWLEPVADTFLQDVKISSDWPAASVRLQAVVDRPAPGDEVVAVVYQGEHEATRGHSRAGEPLVLSLKNPQPWSPDHPFLYNVEMELTRSGKVLDRINSYFGFRRIAIGRDESGVTRILLNDHYLFEKGPLDQGFWPDGIYTAPTEEAMAYDLRILKKLGFNMLRKHVKVEPRRFYYWCDRLGLMVWQDMPSGDASIDPNQADIQRSPESAQQYYLELGRMIAALYNHPSIVMWVPFNEGWGQFETQQVVDFIHKADPTRLVDQASGWSERGAGDVVDWHAYPGPASPPPEEKRAIVLGEFGGLGLKVPGHMWQEKSWGYQTMTDFANLNQRYQELWEKVWELEKSGLSAAVYTQTTDVETEANGLMTYDRAVIKTDTTRCRQWHRTATLRID